MAEKFVSSQNLTDYHAEADKYFANKDELKPLAKTTDLDAYVKDADLPDKLEDYVKDDELETTLGDYVKDEELTETLDGYVTDDELASATEDFVDETTVDGKITALETKLDGKYGAGLVFAGTSTFEALPDPSKDLVGKMYSLTTEGEITSTNADKWVEEQGTKINKGTDVAVSEPTSGTYKWNALATEQDLSSLAQKSELPEAMTKQEILAIFSA